MRTLICIGARQLYQKMFELVKGVFNKEGEVEKEKAVDPTAQPDGEKMEEEEKSTMSAPAANSAAQSKEEEGKGRGGYPFALSFGSGYSGTQNHEVPVNDQLIGTMPKVRMILILAASFADTMAFFRFLAYRSHRYCAIGPRKGLKPIMTKKRYLTLLGLTRLVMLSLPSYGHDHRWWNTRALMK